MLTRTYFTHKSHKHQTRCCAFSRTLITTVCLSVIYWQRCRCKKKGGLE